MNRIRALTLLGIPLALGLAIHHSALLWRRIETLEIAEPLVLMRWLGVAAILALVALLRRQRVSLLRGRGAVVIWLLIALLHVGVGSDGRPAHHDQPIELLVISLSVALAAVPLAAAIGTLTTLRLSGLVGTIEHSFTAAAPPGGYSPRPPPLV
jgi:hypothetical protein